MASIEEVLQISKRMHRTLPAPPTVFQALYFGTNCLRPTFVDVSTTELFHSNVSPSAVIYEPYLVPNANYVDMEDDEFRGRSDNEEESEVATTPIAAQDCTCFEIVTWTYQHFPDIPSIMLANPIENKLVNKIIQTPICQQHTWYGGVLLVKHSQWQPDHITYANAEDIALFRVLLAK
ncbi:hypothetical protein SERLA73DRAFT_78748 [Serpula lacrymans var. lacrymans S7.3]|uniref:Uncharacterized protein n=1 Tax=Serpula lacrymans var. lacrymans (strain S7.3) TaxID=936435 RepID=F8QE78_SERL3|nr:hypothetical protein SERLA73DRAFT_78748 [Serpula lacrymans var. lacrymans S7.3]